MRRGGELRGWGKGVVGGKCGMGGAYGVGGKVGWVERWDAGSCGALDMVVYGQLWSVGKSGKVRKVAA